MIIMKFWGSSVGSGARIANVAALVIAEKRKKVVVTSAVGGVTDKLLNFANDIVNQPTAVVESKVDAFENEIRQINHEVIEEAISKKRIQDETKKKVGQLINKLRITLLGVGYLEDLSAKSLDYILSFGERMCAPIVTGAIENKGVKSCSLTGYEAGIVTDSYFGGAHPLNDLSTEQSRKILNPLLKKGITPVVTGYIAADQEARITTLGRGGSDYTASLLGRYLEADEVQIWTDVDGILSTDPRLVPSAKLLPELSYAEAMDLAYFGAKVIHSKMIHPAMMMNIPVRVKNTFRPEGEGTLIVRQEKKIDRVIKAVAVDDKVTVINLQGIGMTETPNIAGRVFSILGNNHINVIMISGSSESNLSFVVANKDFRTAYELLNDEFKTNGGVKGLGVIEEACLITVVGVGMAGTKGIAAQIFNTVSEAQANIIMIAQGSSEVNVAFVVKKEDAKNALNALHQRFIEDDEEKQASG